jgi:predicted nucleotidyltransferase
MGREGKAIMLTIPEIKERLTPVLKEYDVKEAFLFGSYARGEATEKSDVDIRVDSGESKKLRSLFSESGFYLKLKEALGCEIDLITCLPHGPLSEQFRDNLKREEVKIYGDAN